MGKFIRAEKISYSYPHYEDELSTEAGKDLKALDGVSLDVEKGQFICILGSNGSGKSTLARHLNALLVPDEGTVWIGEMDSRDKELLWKIRSTTGMVFQNPDNQMIASRIDEEVAFGLENLGVPSEKIEQDVKKALSDVGMDGFETENPLNLSGGQKQRVAVAGVLVMKPECIVLDESTAMLDPAGRREIMDTIRQINQIHKVTVICITHYMDEAVNADRIFVMDKGRIILQGTPHEVFSKEEELSRAGLMLPVICQLAGELRSMGMNIPRGIITEDELRQCIINYNTL